MPELTTDEICHKVQMLAMPILEKAGVELVELGVGRYKQDVVIRFAADTPKGGITIAQCSALNRAIVEAIDVDGFMGEAGYSLEFSSPGLDRPLSTIKDFSRNVGRAVHFWLTEAVQGKREYQGILVSIQEGNLVVLMKKKQEIVLSLGQIEKGMLVI